MGDGNTAALRVMDCIGVFIKCHDGSSKRVYHDRRRHMRENAIWLREKLYKCGGKLEVHYTERGARRDIVDQTQILYGVEVVGYDEDGSIDITFEDYEYVE